MRDEDIKEYSEAIDKLEKYNNTKNYEEIALAERCACKALDLDPNYNNPLYLLYNGVGIAYLNEKKYREAEKLARSIVILMPDSALAWYSWGLALHFLRDNEEEALECFDEGLKKTDSLEKHKIESELCVMKAITLRSLKRYNEAIEYFDQALWTKHHGTKQSIGFIWGHYGLTLEVMGKDSKNEKLMNEGEDAYRKAIEYFPEFISVRAALARRCNARYVFNWNEIPGKDDGRLLEILAQKFGIDWAKTANIEKIDIGKTIKVFAGEKFLLLRLDDNKTKVILEFAGGRTEEFGAKMQNDKLNIHMMRKDGEQAKSKECESAREYSRALKDLNEYNQACFYINYGDENIAQKLLEVAVKNKQITYQWLKADPDWDSVKYEDWFIELLNKLKNNTQEDIDIGRLICRAAIRGKLDKVSRKEPSCLSAYDLRDPRGLANKLKESQDISKYIVRGFSDRTKQKLKEYKGDNDSVEQSIELKDILSEEFNKLIGKKSTIKNIRLYLNDNECYNLNRIILTAAYSSEINKFTNNIFSKANPFLIKGDIMDPKSLANRLRSKQDGVSRWLDEKFSQNVREMIKKYDGVRKPTIELRDAIITDLNKLLRLTDMSDQLIDSLNDNECYNLNRIIIASAYPPGITETHIKISAKESSLLCRYDIADIKCLVDRLKASLDKISDPQDIMSEYVVSKFPKEIRNELLEYDGSIELPKKLRNDLIIELNKLLGHKNLYEEDRFKDIQKTLTNITKEQIKQELNKKQMQNLNRKLLAAAYPDQIKGGRTVPEIEEKIGKLIEKKAAYVKARFYAVFGYTDKAFEALSIAVLKERISAETLKFEPDFESIRDDTRFRDLLNRGENKKYRWE